MNRFTLSILVLFGAAFLYSCISEDENLEVIFEQDKRKIAEFVEDYDTEYARIDTVGDTGVVLIFTEVNAEGRKPEIADTLRVDYTGYLLDGIVFDTSIEQVARDNGLYNQSRNYEPWRMELGVTSVIAGWHLALSQMREGEKATVLIPSFYGYGSQPNGAIPANSVLVFDLDLVSVSGPEDN